MLVHLQSTHLLEKVRSKSGPTPRKAKEMHVFQGTHAFSQSVNFLPSTDEPRLKDWGVELMSAVGFDIGYSNLCVVHGTEGKPVTKILRQAPATMLHENIERSAPFVVPDELSLKASKRMTTEHTHRRRAGHATASIRRLTLPPEQFRTRPAGYMSL